MYEQLIDLAVIQTVKHRSGLEFAQWDGTNM
jgi:hypothetical protein